MLALACCFSTAAPIRRARPRRSSRSASLPAVVWMSISGLGSRHALGGGHVHVLVPRARRLRRPDRPPCAARPATGAAPGPGSLWTSVSGRRAPGPPTPSRRPPGRGSARARRSCWPPSTRPPAAGAAGPGLDGAAALRAGRLGPAAPAEVPAARWGWLPLLAGLAVGDALAPLAGSTSAEVAQRRAGRRAQARRHPGRGASDDRAWSSASGSTCRCGPTSCRCRPRPRWRSRRRRSPTATRCCGRCCATSSGTLRSTSRAPRGRRRGRAARGATARPARRSAATVRVELPGTGGLEGRRGRRRHRPAGWCSTPPTAAAAGGRRRRARRYRRRTRALGTIGA